MTAMERISGCLLAGMASLNPVAVRFIAQLDALVLLPIVFTGVGYLLSLKLAAATKTAPSPNLAAQALLWVSGWLSAILLPVSHLNIEEPVSRLWLVTISIFIVILGVPAQGYLLGIPDSQQKSVVRGIYAAIVLLCLWQILLGDRNT